MNRHASGIHSLTQFCLAPWETIAMYYMTCRPQEGAADGAFRLDLSGWQLRCGLSWRL